MKKIVAIILSIIFIAGLCIFLLGHYFSIYPPIPVGYKKGHLIIYSFACADLCPLEGSWYKKYYGEISYDQCLEMGGSPKLVGMVIYGPDGKPGNNGMGGYDGCKAD